MLAIPPKRTERNLLTYLTDPEVDALLAACDQTTWTGRRDHAMLALDDPDRAADLRTDLPHPPRRHAHRRRQRAHHRQGTKAETNAAHPGDQNGAQSLARTSAPAPPTTRCSRPPPATASAATRSNTDSPSTSQTAATSCPSIKTKHITMHTLRHTAAMRLLLAGNDITVIALWLGHEQITTTQIYLHADMTHKQQAIDRTRPLAAKPGRYRPPDTLLAFLEAL